MLLWHGSRRHLEGLLRERARHLNHACWPDAPDHGANGESVNWRHLERTSKRTLLSVYNECGPVRALVA